LNIGSTRGTQIRWIWWWTWVV